MGARSSLFFALLRPLRASSSLARIVLRSSPLLSGYGVSGRNSRFQGSSLSPDPGISRGISSFVSGDGGRRRQRPSAFDVAEIVEIITGDGGEMDERLNEVSVNWSRNLVGEVILSLSDSGASAVPFFGWLAKSRPDLVADPGICNLVIDNLGRKRDFARMTTLLKELSRRGHCLTEKAFSFLKLQICSPSTDSAMDSVRRVLNILRKAGGSSLGSGIFYLIKFLADLGSFELAITVIEEMKAPRVNYFNALIGAKCRNGDFLDAHNLFDEMRKLGCQPTTQSFNYLLGSLFKNDEFDRARDLLQSMGTSGCAPDALTYEIMIVNACRVNRVDLAGEFLSRMLTEGVRPRLTTHGTFIKSLFRMGGLTEARGYVDFMKNVDGSITNANYSLLASLLRVNGRLVEAAELLMEMMANNLKPNFCVYVRLSKDLYLAGYGELAAALKCRFLEFDHRKPASSL